MTLVSVVSPIDVLVKLCSCAAGLSILGVAGSSSVEIVIVGGFPTW